MESLIVKFSDKFLSNQEENKKYFHDDDSFDKKLYSAIIKANNMKTFESEYSFELHEHFTMDDMSVSPVNFALFETLIRLKPYSNILEIGTFLGGTSTRFANIVGENGRVTTIEKFDEFAQIAKRNFRKNCQFDNIELIIGDAMKVLHGIDEKSKFDFVFIDGNKEHYYDYLIQVDKMLVPGGMIIIDDIFFNGDSLNSKPKTEKGAGVKKVLENLSEFLNYGITALPIGNGCLIMTHKG
jgi:caffeoyl-CoA O-methyltransferase/O-methyltransferase